MIPLLEKSSNPVDESSVVSIGVVTVTAGSGPDAPVVVNV